MEAWVVGAFHLLDDGVVEKDELVWISDCLREIEENTLTLSQDVNDHHLVCMHNAMVVAVEVEIEPTLEKFGNLHGILLRIADLVVTDPNLFQKELHVAKYI